MIRLPTPSRLTGLVLCSLALAGCAYFKVEDSIGQLNRELRDFSGAEIELVQTEAQRAQQRQTAVTYLAKELGQDDAVRLALVNSPALQRLLAQSWADAGQIAAGAQLANPTFSLERFTTLDGLEIGRRLSFGLFELLMLPMRQELAEKGKARVQMQLTIEVMDQITQVRQAWIKAVAARQTLTYMQQVYDAAQASAELARRMLAVGNFSKLQRARQQSFYADAAIGLAGAHHEVTASQEALVRALGLSSDQALQLKLPARLPDLPAQPRDPGSVSKTVNAQRLDIRLAKAGLDAALKAQGVSALTDVMDIELGVGRDTAFDNDAGTRSTSRGVEVSVSLPVFNWGGLRRQAMGAQTLAAANHLESTIRAAGSNLRESYSAYRTAHDIARHYRTEILPLKQLIADENLLRYNGMIIGVFELLAESRNQIASVLASIVAERQFWLANADLQAAELGRPGLSVLGWGSGMQSEGGDAAH